MNAHDRNIGKLHEALARMGDIYKPADVVRLVARGDLQCFVDGDSFILTQVMQFPNRRVVDILCAVGDLPNALVLHDKAVEFAIEQRASLMRAQARPGWKKLSEQRGWTPVNVVYYKEL